MKPLPLVLLMACVVARPLLAEELPQTTSLAAEAEMSPAARHRVGADELGISAGRSTERTSAIDVALAHRVSPSLVLGVHGESNHSRAKGERTSGGADAAYKIMDKLVLGIGIWSGQAADGHSRERLTSARSGVLLKGEQYELGVARESLGTTEVQARWLMVDSSLLFARLLTRQETWEWQAGLEHSMAHWRLGIAYGRSDHSGSVASQVERRLGGGWAIGIRAKRGQDRGALALLVGFGSTAVP